LSKTEIAAWPNNPSFTEEELAALVGVSAKTLYRLRSEGKISYSRVADVVHYTRADWEEYLANSRRPQSAFQPRPWRKDS
jgi:predicted site-specific integrase-resolvase